MRIAEGKYVPPEIMEKLERRQAAKKRLKEAADKLIDLASKLPTDEEQLKNVTNNIH